MNTKFITGVSTTLYPPVDPPQITHGPEPQKDIVPGSTVRFTVSATGGGDLTYKWQQNGADLDPLPGVSGDTTSTLQINNVKKSHQGDYTCIVSNAAGPTTSERAQLTIRKCFYLLFIVYAAMKSSVCVCVCCVYVWVCMCGCVCTSKSVWGGVQKFADIG